MGDHKTTRGPMGPGSALKIESWKSKNSIGESEIGGI